jgi:hypothetical protein
MLYESKSRPWNALELLSDIGADDIKISQAEKDEVEPYIWKDLTSEYDAEHFCIMLEESGLAFSDEFISFEKVWRRDEYNHYLGFRRIYSLFYGESEAGITSRLQARVPDFSSLQDYFRDEFKLCLLLAYDEHVTTRAFNEDIPFYKTLGPDAFNQWIRLVKGDEAMHYMNALRVAQTRHQDRLSEAAPIMEHILELDLSGEYAATFVLDHKGPPFTAQMLRDSQATVLDTLLRPLPAMSWY